MEFSKEQGIVIEAYGSLTYVILIVYLVFTLTTFFSTSPITQYPGGSVDHVLQAIGDRIGGTPAQVIFKWLQSKGVVIVT